MSEPPHDRSRVTPLNYVSAPKKRRRGDPIDLFTMLTVSFLALFFAVTFVAVAVDPITDIGTDRMSIGKLIGSAIALSVAIVCGAGSITLASNGIRAYLGKPRS